MKRMPLSELERRCQKPDHRRIGNWMARRLVRPAALRITWVVAPWGVSADCATLAAWACGVAGSLAFAVGGAAGWIAGAALLQAWYLLDHVDGQLARYHGTACLDGVQLDYLMHHTINLLVPLGIGWGLFADSATPAWMLLGVAWAVALLLLSLQHDTRYKAFVQRLKRLRGKLVVHGGGGGRPQAQPPIPAGWLRRLGWVARKSTEMHVLMNLLGLVAMATLIVGDRRLLLARLVVVVAAAMALPTAVWTIARSRRLQSAETEFAAWYQLPAGQVLVLRDGWWVCEDAQTPQAGDSRLSSG
ncbi:MAG: hypothetical protein ACYC6Y_00585 [Thermoguttaceae bacterium]